MLFIFASLLSVTFAQAQEVPFELYQKLFPFHAEFCAGSKVDAYKTGDGGYGGHALLYVNGLCKDYSVSYPKVIPCSQVKNADHAGVGVNVNSDYRNVNWVAVPGREYFFNGEQNADVLVNDAMLTKISQVAFEKRIYEGVQINPETVKQNLNRKAYEIDVGRSTIGTDIAIRMARNLKCIRIPLNEKSLQPMANYLNEVNAPYLAGKKEYEWSGLYNNCAHLSANALAQAGVRNSIPTELNPVLQVFNLAIPYNGFVTLIDRTQYQSIQLRDVYDRKLDRANLMHLNWLPTGLGAIAGEQRFFKNNQININCAEALHEVPAKPLHRTVTLSKQTEQSLTQAKYMQVKQNAKFWLKEYKAAYLSAVADKRFKDVKFKRAYLVYIQGQIKLARAILASN